MLRINRSSAYKIITRALVYESRPLTAVLKPGAQDCDVCENDQQLLDLPRLHPDAAVDYNQHENALAQIEQLALPKAQIYIEIRQDTRGVLGLHAIRKHNNRHKTLELIYA